MTARFKALLQNHCMGILLALLTAIICAFPQVYFRIDHAEVYEDGVETIEMIVSSNWSPRVREVQDGHPNWGSIYFKDGKEGPYLFQPLGSIVVAYTGKLFGLEINNTILLSRIIFPFLAYILMYSFVFLLSRSKLVSLVSTTSILLIGAILSPAGVQVLINKIILQGVSPVNYLEISHPVNSSMIFVFLFGFLVAFLMYYRTWSLWWGILSAILLGLNFYNYFYSWTYLFALLGTLTLVLFFDRRWMEVRRVLYIFIGGLIVAIPYLLNLHDATLHPTYLELSQRHGVLTSHMPLFVGATVFLAAIIFFLGFPREDRRRYLFALSLLLTPIVTMNQQILTGKVLQVGHYHWYMHQPIALILACIVVFSLFERLRIERIYVKLFATILIVISVSIGFRIQVLSYAAQNNTESGDGAAVTIERQKYAPVMQWLDENADKEAVVFANEKTSNIVTIYTSLNVFHHHADHLTLPATDKRLEDIIFTFYRLRGVNEENVAKVFTEERANLSIKMHGIHYRDKYGSDEHIPDEVINRHITSFTNTLSVPFDEWLENIWRKYEVEYVIWDTEADPDWEMDNFTFLTHVETFGKIHVYTFTPDNGDE